MIFLFISFILLTLGAIAAMSFKRENALYILPPALICAAAVLALIGALPVLIGSTGIEVSNLWHLDRFAAFLTGIIAYLAVAGALVSIRYMKTERHEKVVSLSDVRIYFAFLSLFILSMLVAVVAQQLFLLWIALEATTLTTTLLVSLYKKDASLEAGWKYLLICSTGISLGLVGLMVIGYALRLSGIPIELSHFSFETLITFAEQLNPTLLLIGFIFLLVGFGTKVGLVPMHTWLPDAHSKAPSPISALLSGMLLTVALSPIVRFHEVLRVAGLDARADQLFLIFGTLSIIIPAFIFLIQNNYKRLLAYSSIEHMGIIVFSLGLGPAGVAPALIHIVGHSLLKSSLFFGAGEVLLHMKTTKIDQLKSLWKKLPLTSVLFLICIGLLLAIPPSGLFLSEFLIFSVALPQHPILSIVLLFFLTVAAVGMVRAVGRMIGGDGEEKHEKKAKKERFTVTHAFMILNILLMIALGGWFLSERGFSFMTTILG